MQYTKFQAPEKSGSEEDFLNVFLCISVIQTKDPTRRVHCIPGAKI